MTGSAEVRVRAPHAADWALAHGIGSMRTDDLARLLAVPEAQVRVRLHAPMQRGEWVQPARGLWIPVAPEYRTWGAPPGIEVVAALAAHLGIDYYVGWLSAAAIHGAAHQAPQVFQVAASRPVRNRVVGRTRFEFHARPTARVPVVEIETRSGSAAVSSIAATMLDVASDPSLAGGIDNAATVLVELAESVRFDAADLVGLATAYPPSAVRRLGWVLEHSAERRMTEQLGDLRALAITGPRTPARLDPTRDLTGALDAAWLVRINRDVEPDL